MERQVPSMDIGVLAEIVGDDPVVMDEVLRAFYRSASQSVEQIRGAFENGSMQVIADASHKLKSGALTIGALPLGRLCDQIERAAQAPTSEALDTLVLLFESEVRAVQLILEARWS